MAFPPGANNSRPEGIAPPPAAIPLRPGAAPASSRNHNFPLLWSECLRLEVGGPSLVEKTAAGPVPLRGVHLNINNLFCKAKARIKVALSMFVNHSLISFVR